MKTTKVTLQGQDFILSAAAEPILVEHLKKLQRRTHYQRGVYRQNIEALRDVLLVGGLKTVSKPRLVRAIELVGVPESVPRGGPAISKLLQFVGFQWFFGIIRRHSAASWIHRLMWAGGLAAALFALVVGAYTIAVFNLQSQKSGWAVLQTSIGAVRVWQEKPVADTAHWAQSWVIAALYCVSLSILAAGLLYGARRKQWHLPIFLSVISLVTMCMLAYTTADMSIPPSAEVATGAAAAPLKPRLSYLQQCGDEIPYVFENHTGGMLFRQLRDEGFRLAAPVPTRISDGTIDVSALCKTYDALRRAHTARAIVLQLYSTAADGEPHPYSFSDLIQPAVTSTYGFFVKA